MYQMQSKGMSLFEVTLSTFVGLAVAIVTQILIFPFFGIHVPLHHNFMIAGVFTIVSIIRSYLMRRLFNYIQFKKWQAWSEYYAEEEI